MDHVLGLDCMPRPPAEKLWYMNKTITPLKVVIVTIQLASKTKLAITTAAVTTTAAATTATTTTTTTTTTATTTKLIEYCNSLRWRERFADASDEIRLQAKPTITEYSEIINMIYE